MATEKMEEWDAVIVRNLDQLNSAANRLSFEIEPRIKKVIDEIAEKWAKTNAWSGEFDWWKGNLWFAPDNWKSDEEWLGQFHLDGGPDDEFASVPDEDVFWLTRLCQKGRGVLGFRWWYGDGLGTTKNKWKKFIRDHADCVEAIGKQGFVVEDSGLFFTEVKVDAEKLADAIQEDSIETVLQPLHDALDQILAAKSQFDTLIARAQKNFGA